MKNTNKALAVHPEFQLYQKNNTAFCSSRQVAEAFEKRHDNVLRDIRNLNCSENFYKLNFEEIRWTVDLGQGRTRNDPMFLMTKNGFIFLITGYTGEKAGAIKEAYIERFDAMEAFIKDYILAKDEFPIFTQAIADAYETPQPYHYSNEMNMIYRIVLGIDAKTFREIHGLKHGESIRPFLSDAQHKAIRKLQTEDIRLLYKGAGYEDRKNALAVKALAGHKKTDSVLLCSRQRLKTQ